ncbi:MAG: hypothetical protein PHH60_02850 [Candidatus Margulisbacteria bacterium]|nr:hypothetical protein [Candidatus Margulisiibacteriota bacterium]
MSRTQKILEGIAQSGRVAGAYLFVGPPESGKKAAADFFAGMLQCARQDKFLVAPSGASLKIDQVRELQSWVRFGPAAGPYLMVVVEGADTLTAEAAAAFLKTLEEPVPGVVFILLAEREDKLPATILSRCQKVIFEDKLIAWRPSPELNPFYEEIKKAGGRGPLELLGLSARLEKEKERLEDLLYDLAYFARYELADSRLARIILDTLRYIKRKANLKLALDVMCLKLGGENV